MRSYNIAPVLVSLKIGNVVYNPIIGKCGCGGVFRDPHEFPCIIECSLQCGRSLHMSVGNMTKGQKVILHEYRQR